MKWIIPPAIYIALILLLSYLASGCDKREQGQEMTPSSPECPATTKATLVADKEGRLYIKCLPLSSSST